MEAFFGFIVLLVLIVFGLPTLAGALLFGRTRRLRRELDALRERLDTLEAAVSVRSPLEAPPRPAPASAPKPATVSAPQPVTIDARPAAPAAAPPIEPRPERPLVPPPPVRREPVEHPPAEHESLESRIGGRWLLNIGIVMMVIGVAYAEKLAIEKRWINETARVIQGGLFGAALIYAGGRFARRGYAFYGQMLIGGGVAILYVSTYAAFEYYHLIGRPLAFSLMVAVTAFGAWLADRHGSQGLAVLAVGGGFVTPFLLPGNADAQTALFTYDAILIGGTVYLARRRAWPLLNVVSYVFTLLTVAGWADRFYTSDKYLRTEVYLTVFCAMFVTIAWSCRRIADSFAEFASWFVWTAPIAYYFASQVVLAGHPQALLVWLIGVAITAGILSAVAGSAIALVVWLAAAVPLLAWTMPPTGARWLTRGLVTVAALYGVGLAAQLRLAGEKRLDTADIAWLHLNALLMFAAAYFLLEPEHLAAAGPAGAVFAAWHGVLASVFWTRDRDRGIHYAALAFTLLSIAIALQFDGPAVTVGWAAEGTAIIVLGSIERREWMRLGGTLLFAIAVWRTLELLLSDVPANHVVLLNPRAACALLVIALSYGLAWRHRRTTDAAVEPVGVALPIVVAQVLSLVLLTTEIHAYYAVRGDAFTRELLVSVTWAVYATVLIVIGLQRGYAPLRYFALGLFGVTIAKVFFSDLAELQRIYRVLSVIGLGITLLLTSYLYQRVRRSPTSEDAAP